MPSPSWKPDDLPGTGLDAALESGFRDFESGPPPAILSALLAVVGAGHQKSGLSRVVLMAMEKVAAEHELDTLIAPVRPTMKSVYPLTPMERYIGVRMASSSTRGCASTGGSARRSSASRRSQ